MKKVAEQGWMPNDAYAQQAAAMNPQLTRAYNTYDRLVTRPKLPKQAPPLWRGVERAGIKNMARARGYGNKRAPVVDQARLASALRGLQLKGRTADSLTPEAMKEIEQRSNDMAQAVAEFMYHPVVGQPLTQAALGVPVLGDVVREMTPSRAMGQAMMRGMRGWESTPLHPVYGRRAQLLSDRVLREMFNRKGLSENYDFTSGLTPDQVASVVEYAGRQGVLPEVTVGPRGRINERQMGAMLAKIKALNRLAAVQAYPYPQI